MAAVLARFLPGAAEDAFLDRFVKPTLRSWNGVPLGELRLTL